MNMPKMRVLKEGAVDRTMGKGPKTDTTLAAGPGAAGMKKATIARAYPGCDPRDMGKGADKY